MRLSPRRARTVSRPPRRSLRRAAPAVALALVLPLSACAGKNAVDQSAGTYRYVSSTTLGTLIAVKDRKKAGDFTVEKLSGSGSYSLSQFQGRVLLVNYWASWCGPCVGEAPQLNLVYGQYKGKGVTILGVDTKDTRSNAQAFVADNKITYPNAFDANGQSALQIGKVPSVSLPFSVLIDQQGRVAAVYSGRVSPADLTPVLDKLLAES